MSPDQADRLADSFKAVWDDDAEPLPSDHPPAQLPTQEAAERAKIASAPANTLKPVAPAKDTASKLGAIGAQIPGTLRDSASPPGFLSGSPTQTLHGMAPVRVGKGPEDEPPKDIGLSPKTTMVGLAPAPETLKQIREAADAAPPPVHPIPPHPDEKANPDFEAASPSSSSPAEKSAAEKSIPSAPASAPSSTDANESPEASPESRASSSPAHAPPASLDDVIAPAAGSASTIILGENYAAQPKGSNTLWVAVGAGTTAALLTFFILNGRSDNAPEPSQADSDTATSVSPPPAPAPPPAPPSAEAADEIPTENPAAEVDDTTPEATQAAPPPPPRRPPFQRRFQPG